MKKLLLLNLAILASLFFQNAQAQQTFLTVSSKSEPATKAYYQGMEYALNAEFQEMMAQMDKAIAADPDFFMAYFQSALTQAWFGNWKGFEEQHAKAMACKTKLNKAELICKEILIHLNKERNFDESTLGKKLVDAAPKVVEAHIWHGQLSRSQPEVAARAYEQALVLDPSLPALHNLLGYAYMENGEMAKAEKAFDEYIKLKPGHANPYDSKGDYLMAAGQYPEAEKHFRKAFKMNESFTGSNNKAELAAAMQVAARETTSFMKRDFEGWAECWKKGPAVSFAYTDKEGSWIYQGWEQVAQAAKEIMKGNPDPIEGGITRSDFSWRVKPDNVYVTFTQKMGNSSTKEMRVLDKMDGKYRILLMNAINTTSYEQPANTLKSVSIFKPSTPADFEVLKTSLDRMNATIEAIGYPDAGYQLWETKGEDGTAQLMVEGYWPGQDAYNAIHEHELYKKAWAEEDPKWKSLKRLSYHRFNSVK